MRNNVADFVDQSIGCVIISAVLSTEIDMNIVIISRKVSQDMYPGQLQTENRCFY